MDRFANNNNNMYDINNSKLGNSNNPEIAAFGNKVYIVWNQETQNYNNNGNDTNPFIYKILFRASDDNGSTFKSIKTLSTNATYFSYPKITAAASSSISNGSNVYVVWNVGFPIDDLYKKLEGIFFTKSSDGGNIFSNITKISGPIKSIGKPQIISYKNNIYVAWAGIPDFRIGGNVFYIKSVDRGNKYVSFTNPISLTDNNSINVDLAVNKDNLYVVWEGLSSDTNDDVFLKTGNNNTVNQYFTKDAINLSNNKGLSECPSIALSNNNNNTRLFVAWEDSTPGNHEIFFIRGKS